MVDVATALRGINAACNDHQSRPVATNGWLLGRRGSFMILYARFHDFTLGAAFACSALCLASLKSTPTPRAPTSSEPSN